MSLVKIAIAANPVLRTLKQAERRSRDLRSPFRDARKEFRAEQRAHFKHQEGPDGRWPARASRTESRALRKAQAAAATKKGRTRRPRKAPKPLGKLRQFAVRVRRWSLTAESPVPWSGVHQRGGSVGRGATVPARPFLWVRRRWIRTHITPRILRHLLAPWRRR